MLKEIEVIASAVLRAMLCGSRVTCVPAPTDTDQDVIVLVRDIDASACWKGGKSYRSYADEVERPLADAGFERGGSGSDDDDFESWTKGDINLILTADTEFYERFVAATTVARRLNVLDKEDRKALFRAALYGEACYFPGSDGLPPKLSEIPF